MLPVEFFISAINGVNVMRSMARLFGDSVSAVHSLFKGAEILHNSQLNFRFNRILLSCLMKIEVS